MSRYDRYQRLLGLAEKLEVYADLEGCELGEATSFLIAGPRFIDHLSDEFMASLEKEMQELLNKYTTEAEIVDHEEEIVRTVTVRELVWHE